MYPLDSMEWITTFHNKGDNGQIIKNFIAKPTFLFQDIFMQNVAFICH